MPFFAYGIFKPGQLAYRQLQDLVESVESAFVEGQLYERDGLPILKLGGSSRVKGSLIQFKPGKEAEAYERIKRLEPEIQYRWQALTVSTQGGILEAQALLGRNPEKGSVPLDDKEWDGANDPLFTTAIEVVEETLINNSDFEWDLKPLFRLEMGYLLLWSAIERFASFSYHLGSDPWQKSDRSHKNQHLRRPCASMCKRKDVSSGRIDRVSM